MGLSIKDRKHPEAILTFILPPRPYSGSGLRQAAVGQVDPSFDELGNLSFLDVYIPSVSRGLIFHYSTSMFFYRYGVLLRWIEEGRKGLKAAPIANPLLKCLHDQPPQTSPPIPSGSIEWASQCPGCQPLPPSLPRYPPHNIQGHSVICLNVQAPALYCNVSRQTIERLSRDPTLTYIWHRVCCMDLEPRQRVHSTEVHL